MSAQEIKKNADGTIEFRLDPEYGWYWDRDGKLTEEYYHDVMFMEDLYITFINGYGYLVDYNTRLVYGLEFEFGKSYLQTLLDDIHDCYKNDEVFVLIPFSKEESEELLIQEENGY